MRSNTPPFAPLSPDRRAAGMTTQVSYGVEPSIHVCGQSRDAPLQLSAANRGLADGMVDSSELAGDRPLRKIRRFSEVLSISSGRILPRTGVTMLRVVLLVSVLVVVVPVLAPVVQACGDKFLMVGRGARFQRVYASVYPGKVLIFARPATDPKAAIRDPQLHRALRQAGHAVSVIEDWTLLEQALKSVPMDVVLVDVGEAEELQKVIASSPGHPEALYVAMPSAPPQKQIVCKLKATDRPVRFLDEVENVMKTRARRAKS